MIVSRDISIYVVGTIRTSEFPDNRSEHTLPVAAVPIAQTHATQQICSVQFNRFCGFRTYLLSNLKDRTLSVFVLWFFNYIFMFKRVMQFFKSSYFT